MEAHPGPLEVYLYLLAVKAHPGALKTRALEAHSGAMEAHPGAL
jgi:hypothetical protein